MTPEDRKERYESHKDEELAQNKQYRENNSIKIQTQRKGYRENNKEVIRLKKKADYEANKEKRKEQMRLNYLKKKGNTPKEKSMHTKMLLGEISSTDYQLHCVIKQGFKDIAEYQNHIAQRNGMKDRNEMHNKNRYTAGTRNPLGTNPECASYLGVHIAERILSHVFEQVTRMPSNNTRYDFICKKGYKIDVKSACFDSRKSWHYSIRKNQIADYFLCLAFDNRKDLNPQHVWLIRGKDIINSVELNSMSDLRIYGTQIEKYNGYEIKDKLDQVIACCEGLK